jgi:hypothetical protein
MLSGVKAVKVCATVGHRHVSADAAALSPLSVVGYGRGHRVDAGADADVAAHAGLELSRRITTRGMPRGYMMTFSKLEHRVSGWMNYSACV